MTKATTDTKAKHAAPKHDAPEHDAPAHTARDRSTRGDADDAGAGHEAANPKTAPHDDAHPSNAVKDPHDWTTGGETMTGAQASYLKTLCEEAKVEFDPALTKAEASMKIDELRNSTGRGKDH